jgi:Zn-dependent protease with chaperone function
MPDFILSISSKNDIPQKSEVGEFKSNIENFRCLILLDDDWVNRSHQREIMATANEDNTGTTYLIILTSSMLKKIQTHKNHFLFSIYHELGHIYHGHIDTDITQEQLYQERESAIANGTISSAELAADAFAIRYCGKSAAINALNIMYNERSRANKAGNLNAEQNLLALKEIELRKKAIQKLTL